MTVAIQVGGTAMESNRSVCEETSMESVNIIVKLGRSGRKRGDCPRVGVHVAIEGMTN